MGALFNLQSDYSLVAVIMKNITLIEVEHIILKAFVVTTDIKNVDVDYNEEKLTKLINESKQRLEKSSQHVTSKFITEIEKVKYYQVL